MGRSVFFRKCGKLAPFFLRHGHDPQQKSHGVTDGSGADEIRVDVDTFKILIQVHDVAPFDTSCTCYFVGVNPQNSL